jgi:hypothetical protein
MPSGYSLNSLRVEAALDASGWETGAQKIVSSSATATGGVNQLAGAVEQTERKLGNSATGFERLQRSIDPAYAASVKLEQGQRNVATALDKGIISICWRPDTITPRRRRMKTPKPSR